MSLETEIIALAEAVGVDVKSLNLKIGDLSQLQTAAKSNLVAAINEAATSGGSGGSGGVAIDDAAGVGDTNATWSADKSSREFADKVDKVSGYSLVADDEIAKLITVEQDAQKNTVISVAGKQGDVLLNKDDVGLSAVDNTSDADKPVSTAVAAALTSKVVKVAGKQLSDENYTTADKDKLRDIADGETYLYILGEYSVGLVVSKPNQIVKFGKVMYLVDEDEPLPYTIIGDDIRDEPLIPLLGGSRSSDHPVISWHGQTVQDSITIPDNVNAWSFGPTMTIADGQTVTVGQGSNWTIN